MSASGPGYVIIIPVASLAPKFLKSNLKYVQTKCLLIFVLHALFCTHTEKQPSLRPLETKDQTLGRCSGLREILGYTENTKPKGSLIHGAVDKSFISRKDVSSPKQPSKCYSDSTPLQAFHQPATVLFAQGLTWPHSITQQQGKVPRDGTARTAVLL